MAPGWWSGDRIEGKVEFNGGDNGGPTMRGQAIVREGRGDDPLYRRHTRLQAPSEPTGYLGTRATGRRQTDRRSKAWLATGGTTHDARGWGVSRKLGACATWGRRVGPREARSMNA
jgi:hypothetical protein